MTNTDQNQSETSLDKRETALPEGVESTHAGKEFLPHTDIYETDENVVIVADMPGVSTAGIDLTLERNLLTLRGRVERRQPEPDQLAYTEYEVGDYVRSFKLTGEVDRDLIEASAKNGVLTLTLPKVGAVARRIEISTK